MDPNYGFHFRDRKSKQRRKTISIFGRRCRRNKNGVDARSRKGSGSIPDRNVNVDSEMRDGLVLFIFDEPAQKQFSFSLVGRSLVVYRS